MVQVLQSHVNPSDMAWAKGLMARLMKRVMDCHVPTVMAALFIVRTEGLLTKEPEHADRPLMHD